MRRSWTRGAALAVVGAALIGGCAGDIAKQVTTDPASQAKVIDAIATNGELAGRVVDRLLAGPTREMVLGKVLANDASAQQILGVVAHNPNALDAVLGLAVGDSLMRRHVMTLFKGMQMAGAR